MASPAAIAVGQEVGSHLSDEVKESALEKQKKLEDDDDDDVFDDDAAAAVHEGGEEEGKQVEDEEGEEGKQGEYIDDPYPVYSSSSESDEEDNERSNRYYQQVDESQGFDVDPDIIPKGRFFGVLHLPLDSCDPLTTKELKDSVDCALEIENREGNENLEFVEILKANFWPCPSSGSVYYITFRARNRCSGEIKTFQARVLCDWSGIEPELFRPKP